MNLTYEVNYLETALFILDSDKDEILGCWDIKKGVFFSDIDLTREVMEFALAAAEEEAIA